MDRWINCNDMLPPEMKDGVGTISEIVEVILSDGTHDEDWLINHRWVVHCKNNGGAYPIKWRDKSCQNIR